MENIHYQKFEEEDFLSIWYLRPDFSTLYRKYGVLIFIEKDGIENSIKYELEIKYLKRIEKTHYLLWIDRVSEVFINDQLPDLLVDQLCYETGKIFYPLQIEIDAQGTFLSVYNMEEIQDRWKKKKRRDK
jgi:hypothetical protein